MKGTFKLFIGAVSRARLAVCGGVNMNIPKANEIYKHFKGNLYQIVAVAQHSETGEQLVIYQALDGEKKIYARPLSMFFDKLDPEKYSQATQEYRFELQQEAESDAAGEELNIDPMVLEFLDAGTYEQKLNILAGLRHRITDDMLTTMAIACDVELPEGDTQERYLGLRNCLVTKDKYESCRMR